jgi:Flp pilus assembly protein TadG
MKSSQNDDLQIKARRASERLRAILRDRSAVTAIEFAFITPLAVGMILMTAQVGLYFYYSTYLYYATEKALRQVETGAVQNQGLTAAQFRTNILCPLLPGSMSCSNVITNVQVIPDTSGGASYWYSLTDYHADPSSPTGFDMSQLNAPPMDNSQTSFCIGVSGSYVAAQVYYAMPIVGIPQLLAGASTYNGNPVVFIQSTHVFRNEPFSTSYAGC